MSYLRRAMAMACLIAGVAAAPAWAGDTLIHAGRLFDVDKGVLVARQTLRIRDGRIIAVTPGFEADPKATVIDLSQETVLPGLIDCHAHITSNYKGSASFRDEMSTSAIDAALIGVANARATLMAGFTSIRDPGARPGSAIALRKAIDKGLVPGPHLWVADAPIGPTGGHSDRRAGLDNAIDSRDWEAAVADGPEAIRAMVRLRSRDGADLIKMMASESGKGDGVHRFDQDEMRALVRTAHGLGMKVAAHTAGDLASLRDAIEAGVDSIEHAGFEGTPAERAQIFAAMRARHTFLVATVYIQEILFERAQQGMNLSKISPEELESVVKRSRMVLGEAYRAGVPIAFGTDTTGLIPHGANGREFAEMVKAGLPPAAAIRAATTGAADLIGASADIGSLAPGHRADIIAVSGDPLADVSLLTAVDFVMKDGEVIKPAPVSPAR